MAVMAMKMIARWLVPATVAARACYLQSTSQQSPKRDALGACGAWDTSFRNYTIVAHWAHVFASRRHMSFGGGSGRRRRAPGCDALRRVKDEAD